MQPSHSVAGLQVENVAFSPMVKPPGSTNHHFLGGAGVRGLDIQGQFVKFTAIGVYLEEDAVPSLAVKWKGKNAEELTESVEFFREIVTGDHPVPHFGPQPLSVGTPGGIPNRDEEALILSLFPRVLARIDPETSPLFLAHLAIRPTLLGPFEKFMMVTMILLLTGEQFAEKVTENCIAIWKSLGVYTDAEEKACEKFREIFKNENFLPGASILFTQSPHGSLTISFSKDGSIPETGKAVIENKLMSEAVLESMIGKNGVSPAARKSMAERLSALLTECNNKNKVAEEPKPEAKTFSQEEKPAVGKNITVV